MIKIIIGKSASGKTLYLDRLIEKRVNEDKKIVVTNRDTMNHYTSLGYNQQRLSVLRDVTISEDYDELKKSNNIITTPGTLYITHSTIELSYEFLYIMQLLCKDADYIYLDEPERWLNRSEIGVLFSFLEKTVKTYIELVIVTHSEILVAMYGADVCTVEMDKNTSNVNLMHVAEADIFDIVD